MTTMSSGEGRHGRGGALRQRLRELYTGTSPAALRFRYGLLVFDLLTIVYLVVSSFRAQAGAFSRSLS
jgi:hypothetical protein